MLDSSRVQVRHTIHTDKHARAKSDEQYLEWGQHVRGQGQLIWNGALPIQRRSSLLPKKKNQSIYYSTPEQRMILEPRGMNHSQSSKLMFLWIRTLINRRRIMKRVTIIRDSTCVTRFTVWSASWGCSKLEIFPGGGGIIGCSDICNCLYI